MSLEVDNDAFISSNNKSEDPLKKTTIRVVLNVKFNLKKWSESEEFYVKFPRFNPVSQCFG